MIRGFRAAGEQAPDNRQLCRPCRGPTGHHGENSDPRQLIPTADNPDSCLMGISLFALT